VAQDNNLLTLVEPLDDFARKHSLTGAGWRFHDKSTVLVYDRREIVDEFLLPTSEMHWVLISKEWMAAQSAGQSQRNLAWARG
jgi:hypothetical protein